MMSITYQPKRKKRKRTHGFRARNRKILTRRRRKKRWRLSV